MVKPDQLTVTWTRPARFVEQFNWHTHRFVVDVGFHTWRTVYGTITQMSFSSPSECADVVANWYDTHTDLVIRTTLQNGHKHGSDFRYCAQVQGTSTVTGQRDDLEHNLRLAVRRPAGQKPIPAPPLLVVDWTFPAQMTRLVDGDTQEFLVDAGFHAERQITDRLLGVNCPETHGESRPAGLAASEFSRQWYDTHRNLVIQTRPDPRKSVDAFRRYLVQVQGTCNQTGIREDLAQCLLGAHQAVPFMVEP